HRHIPHLVVQVQTHEPPEQQIVVQLLHQHPLTADRVQRLQQQGPQQFLGWNRGPPDLRIHPPKQPGQLLQNLVGDLSDRPQRMVRRHSLFGRQVAEHCGLLKVGASHASHPIADSSSLQEIPAFFRSLLVLGTSVRLKRVGLKVSAEQRGWLIYPKEGRAEKSDVQAWVRCTESQLALALSSWLSIPKEFRQLEDLIYGTIRSSSLFPETEFLSLAQAIESLHRLTGVSRLIIPEKSFNEISAFLRERIAEKCQDSPISKSLHDKISSANERSFHDRIDELISPIENEEHVKKLLDDPVDFEQTLRQTRNYLTHPGIRQGSKVLTDPKDLF